MKIPLGGGAYLEPDEEPRTSRFHRRIVSTAPMPHTRTGHYCDLECGHRVMTFGNLEMAGGRVLCTECRDRDTG